MSNFPPKLSARGAEIRTLSSGPGHLFASWRNVYVLDFRGTPSFESLNAATIGKKAIEGEYPGGLVVINLLNGDNPLPSEEVRAHAEKKQREDPVGVICHATVVHGDSFRSSATRTMMAGLYLVGRSPFPRKVFARASDAVEWVREILGESAMFKLSLESALQKMSKL